MQKSTAPVRGSEALLWCWLKGITSHIRLNSRADPPGTPCADLQAMQNVKSVCTSPCCSVHGKCSRFLEAEELVNIQNFPGLISEQSYDEPYGAYEMHRGELHKMQSLHLKEDTEEEYAKALGIYLVQGRVGPLKPFLGHSVCVSIYNCSLFPSHKQGLSCKTTLGRSKLWPQTFNLMRFLKTMAREAELQLTGPSQPALVSSSRCRRALSTWKHRKRSQRINICLLCMFLLHNLSFTKSIIHHVIHYCLENYKLLTLGSRNYILVCVCI